MTRSPWIPGAVHDGPYWFGDTVAVTAMDQITKLVLHSTETPGSGGCPGYAGGTMAPTVTVDPWNRRAWQHFIANGSAKALIDSPTTTVRENRDDVAQIEIVGYCDPAMSSRYGYAISQIPDAGLAYLADVVAWFHDEWGLPLTSGVQWRSYADLAPGRISVRLSGPQFDAYTGLLGHQHVSGNTHLDPGDLDVARILQLATRGGGSDQSQEDDDMANSDEILAELKTANNRLAAIMKGVGDFQNRALQAAIYSHQAMVEQRVNEKRAAAADQADFDRDQATKDAIAEIQASTQKLIDDAAAALPDMSVTPVAAGPAGA